MPPLSLAGLLDYLYDLGIRFSRLNNVAVALPEQYPAPDFTDYPLLLIEPDPFIQELNEGLDAYTVALQFLCRRARTDEAADVALASQAKELAEQYGQQLLREQQVSLSGKPSYTLLYGNADEGLATGVRLELTLAVARPLNRTANLSLFTPLA